jgi:hypothetical protein
MSAPSTKQLSRWQRVSLWGATLAVFYALSVGPAQLLCRHGLIPNRSMQAVYSPLGYFSGTGQNSLLNWYLSFWEW